MKKITNYSLALGFLMLGAQVGHSQIFNWAKTATNRTGITADNNANTYVFSETSIEKRNSAGTLQWTSEIDNFFPLDCVSDNLGNLYLTGYYFSDRSDSDVAWNGPGKSVRVGAGNISVPWTQVPDNNIIGHKMVFVKVNTSGNAVWAKTFSTATDFSMGRSLATDQSNNVYLVAKGATGMNFGPAGTLTGSNPLFLLKVDASGNEVFVKNISSSFAGLDNAPYNEIDVNSSGEIVVASTFSGTRTFNPNGTPTSLTSSGSDDIFIARYSSAGAFQWVKRIGGTGTEDHCTALIDEAGNTYCGGLFAGTVDFNPDAGVANLVSAGNTDMYIMSLNSSGVYRFAERIGGTGAEGFFNMIQTDFDLIVAGGFSGTVDFDPTAATNNMTSAGGKDIFTLTLSKAGVSSPGICYKVGGVNDDVATDICRRKQWNSLTYFECGYFNGTVDFNPTATTTNLVSSVSTPFVTMLTLDTTSGLITNPSDEEGEAVSSVLGLDNNTTQNTVIYPNPFTTTVDLFTSKETTAVTVYDVQGKVVFEDTNLQGQTRLDLSALKRGSYVAIITTQNGEIIQKKINKL